MSVNRRLSELLERHRVAYEVLPHGEAFTAHDVAQSIHVHSQHLAKVVVLHERGRAYLMAVIPASTHLNLHFLRHLTGRPGLALATEDEIAAMFPDCEPGAMPPFGSLYGLSMIMHGCLAEEENLFFQAGNHHEVVRMRFEDFARLARPSISDACLHLQPSMVG